MVGIRLIIRNYQENINHILSRLAHFLLQGNNIDQMQRSTYIINFSFIIKKLYLLKAFLTFFERQAKNKSNMPCITMKFMVS